MTAPEPREDMAVAEVLARVMDSLRFIYGGRASKAEAELIEAVEALLDRAALAIAPLIAERVRAAAMKAWDAGAAVGDELARERTLLWADDQMQALPEHRTPVAHGKAELLTDLRRFLDRADRRAER